MENGTPHALRTLQDIRRANLRALADTYGSKELALQVGWKQTRLSQLIGPTPSRPVTEKTALRIEEKLGLAKGWLSEPREAARA